MRMHQGIRIDKIQVTGAAGVVFVAGIASIFLIGVPTYRPFVLIALVGGLLVGVGLYLWHSTENGRRRFTIVHVDGDERSDEELHGLKRRF